MLTHTSETAIRALIYLSAAPEGRPTSPRVIAAAIHCSPTYLAKTVQLLARSGILRSRKGAHGGVWLARSPKDITLRTIVEACQGLIVGNYCQTLKGAATTAGVCGFHHAMQEIYESTVATLSRWTLADLIAQPAPPGSTSCKMLIKPTHQPSAVHA
jgi:Rrf2 family protein